MVEETRVAVLGGGVTGLCAAHYLAKAFGRGNVLLLEASDYIGGQTRSDNIDGFSCDWGPNGFLDREPLTLKWIEDLGSAHELLRCNESAAHRFIFKDGRLHEVVGPPRFLFAPLLSPMGRLRLCCEPLIKAKRDDAPESVWDFAARRIGREAADLMVTPMVSGVFGGDAKQLSLEHCFPRMADMERRYGGLVKALIAIKKVDKSASPLGPRGTLTTFHRGIGFLPDAAVRPLSDRIRTQTPVTGLFRTDGAYRIQTSAGLTVSAAAVVVALPAHAAAAVAAGLDADCSVALRAIAYADIAVLCTGYRRENVGHDLNGFGFLVPRNQGLRVLGCLWSSSIFPGRAPEGWVQLRTMYGGYTDPDAIRLSDNELIAHLRHEVHPLLQIGGEPEFVRVYRHRPGIPQYLLGHGERLRAIAAAEQRFPGLAFAGNAYRGVGLNDCVVSALRAVDALQKKPNVECSR